MKQIITLFFLVALAINVNAYDFEAKNADGITIYYNYINNGKEVEVTYEAYYKAWDSNKLEYYYYYGGYRGIGNSLVIPETVVYNERSFPVTKIGDNALRDSHVYSITLPNSIKDIASYSFRDSWIKEITIPNGIKKINSYTFSGCTKLVTVSFPEGLEEIGSYSFDGCTSIKNITIPESVTVLSGFTKCTGLTSITIPKSVTDIYFYNCSNLLKIYSYIEEPNDISTIAFADNSYYSGTLYVPKGTIDKYKSKEGWKKFNFIEEMSSDKQCAIPVLSYSNKELSYTCETNGATIHETIKCSDAVTTTFSGSHKLNAVYEISAYATADGYSQSETINAKLYWLDGSLETSNVSNIKANMRGVLIQRNDDFLTISGLANNEKVIVFDISGRQIGNSQSVDGTATFCINKTEKVIVVKIGNESIKVQL
ncbi:MAG: leucine-rich repeat domain-containing protein [Prevotella sp.]|nr:leucine-rich repeat domain-containing protein [Prevotella sp.]MBQ9571084.1 leucine-rich repeat domain-containing protein [Prevotella sp.]